MRNNNNNKHNHNNIIDRYKQTIYIVFGFHNLYEARSGAEAASTARGMVIINSKNQLPSNYIGRSGSFLSGLNPNSDQD